MAKFFKRVFDVIFILIIIALSAYFILRYTNQIMIYRVKTGSMEDNIHAGDYILIIRKDEYNVGDVVTFQRPDGFITHRIIKKDGSKIITKGDANNVEDDTIDESSIVGKAIISGGIVNIIINYKYALIAFLLALYLFSCCLGKETKDNETTDEVDEVVDDEQESLPEENQEKTSKVQSTETTDEVDNTDEKEITPVQNEKKEEVIKEDETTEEESIEETTNETQKEVNTDGSGEEETITETPAQVEENKEQSTEKNEKKEEENTSDIKEESTEKKKNKEKE